MKFLVFIIFALLMFTGTHVQAFTNNSVVTDIPELGSDVVPEADSDQTPPLETGGETLDLFNSSNTQSSEGDNGSGAINEVVVTVSSGSSSENFNDSGGINGSSASNGNSSSSASGTSEETISAQSILNTLSGNQAVTSSGTVSNSVGGSSGGSVGTNISGLKTREALLSRGIIKLTIPPPPIPGTAAAKVRPSYSRGDLALIVSGEIVKTPDIENVFYTANTLSITYQSEGRLLFALPVPYTTKIDLTFDEVTPKKRVRVRFPWFKFLMWTGVSQNSLRTHLDAIITTAPEGKEYDRAAYVFKGVADFLGSSVHRLQ